MLRGFWQREGALIDAGDIAGAVEPAEVVVDLGAITAASLVVSGAKDLPDFGLIAARLAALLPGTRQVELPWAGHLPTAERPQELPGILTAFLREMVPAG